MNELKTRWNDMPIEGRILALVTAPLWLPMVAILLCVFLIFSGVYCGFTLALGGEP